jgi:CubicO group peptidase (beta-lactamase class C family)
VLHVLVRRHQQRGIGMHTQRIGGMAGDRDDLVLPIAKLTAAPIERGVLPLFGERMGWRITQEPIGGRIVWHSGETVGFRNVIIRYPQRRLTLVLLSNRNDPEPYQTAGPSRICY